MLAFHQGYLSSMPLVPAQRQKNECNTEECEYEVEDLVSRPRTRRVSGIV